MPPLATRRLENTIKGNRVGSTTLNQSKSPFLAPSKDRAGRDKRRIRMKMGIRERRRCFTQSPFRDRTGLVMERPVLPYNTPYNICVEVLCL